MASKQPIQVQFPPLHAAQFAAHECPARFRVVDCGRRWGKTLWAVLEAMDAASRGGTVWWVAPDIKRLAPAVKMARKLTAPLKPQGVNWSQTKHKSDIVYFPGGGSIEFRSADDPNGLRGDAIDLVIFDEFAFMKPEAWDEALSPAVASVMGKAIFISSPYGRNHFFQMYRMCRTFVESNEEGTDWKRWTDEAGEPDWAAFKFPTRSNPYFPASELERERRTMTERKFRAEYLADFIDDTSAVFRNVHKVAVAVESDPIPRHIHVIGGDLARVNDFTVFVVIDVTAKRMVKMDRFNQISYDLQISRLEALCNRYKPVTVVIESNKESDVVKRMAARGIPIQPIYTTNALKTLLIEAWAAAMENFEVELLDDEVLINEHLAFEVTQLPGGAYRYAAPKNLHDDTVMASAFAWYAFTQSQIMHQLPMATASLNLYRPGTRRTYPAWSRRERTEDTPRRRR